MGKSRSRGPGGQHRNKVETGVELLHEPTGVEAQATERRSVTENRREALWRLRLALAVRVRTPVGAGEIGSGLWRSRVNRPKAGPGNAAGTDPVLKELGVRLRADAVGADGRSPGRIVVSPEHHDFPSLLAEALDVIASAGWDPKPASARLGVSATQLVKLVKEHPPAFLVLNREREQRGMGSLK
ncbi:MAG: peptide chain release factor family protein [Phycisphaerales bacterium]